MVEVGHSRPGLGMTAQELCDWKWRRHSGGSRKKRFSPWDFKKDEEGKMEM